MWLGAYKYLTFIWKMFESLSLLATVVLLDVIHLHFKVLFMHKSSLKRSVNRDFSAVISGLDCSSYSIVSWLIYPARLNYCVFKQIHITNLTWPSKSLQNNTSVSVRQCSFESVCTHYAEWHPKYSFYILIIEIHCMETCMISHLLCSIIHWELNGLEALERLSIVS